MKMLAIYNSTNKRFRKDGDEFHREALGWCKTQSKPVQIVDVRDGRVRREIRRMTDGLDVLAFFDHGRPHGLPRMRENLGNVTGLAAAIASVTKTITIILYACSCGRGWHGRKGFRWMHRRNKQALHVNIYNYNLRDGYAIALCCELDKLGVCATVWAHLTRGHLTRNPHVISARSHGGTVGRYRKFHPRASAWKKWKRDLKGPLRFTFWQRKSV